MRAILLLLITGLFFISCKKDKFNTVPQIVFKSLSPNSYRSDNLDPNSGPFLSFQLTDAEGDFGFKGKDSSWVYIKNLSTPPFITDSVKFPDLSDLKMTSNLNATISVNLNSALPPASSVPGTTDTLSFEIYVIDFAKNKSNVITSEPLYYITP